MASSYLLDSDIIFDFLLKRTPFNVAAKEIFALALNKKVKVCITSLAIANVHYILQKSVGKVDSLMLVEELTGFSKIISVGENEILLAIQSNFEDFEDAIQHQAALSNSEVQAIITRNLKDYKRSKLPVLSPDSFLALFK